MPFGIRFGKMSRFRIRKLVSGILNILIIASMLLTNLVAARDPSRMRFHRPTQPLKPMISSMIMTVMGTRSSE